MNPAPSKDEPGANRSVVALDDARFDACSAEVIADLMAEAALLADAFAPEGRARQIEALAQELQSGVRDLELGRHHALQLAAALRRLARQAR